MRYERFDTHDGPRFPRAGFVAATLALGLGTAPALAQGQASGAAAADAPAFASCTVEIPEFGPYEKRSGACVADEATDTLVVYDADYWGKRGRKLLVPRTTGGRKPASFIAISPTDVRSNDVAHAMQYGLVILTRQGRYSFSGSTPTRSYTSELPPPYWYSQRPGEAMDLKRRLSADEMLAQARALTPIGPALDLAVVEKVLMRRQSLVERTPTLAGIHEDVRSPPQPVASPVLDMLIHNLLVKGR